MEIQHINEENKGHYKAIQDGKEAGKMTYSWAGTDKFIIDSTTVDPAFKGRSVGKMMVMKAVDYARQNKVKILPLCPFAKSIFDKTEDIKDVLLS